MNGSNTSFEPSWLVTSLFWGGMEPRTPWTKTRGCTSARGIESVALSVTVPHSARTARLDASEGWIQSRKRPVHDPPGGRVTHIPPPVPQVAARLLWENSEPEGKPPQATLAAPGSFP